MGSDDPPKTDPPKASMEAWAWREYRFRVRAAEGAEPPEAPAPWPAPEEKSVDPGTAVPVQDAPREPGFRFRFGGKLRVAILPVAGEPAVAAPRLEFPDGKPVAGEHLCIDLGYGGTPQFHAGHTDEEGRLHLDGEIPERESVLVCLGADDPARCPASLCQPAKLLKRAGSAGLLLQVPRPVPITIPLKVKFASAADARAWLLRNPIDVTLDGVHVRSEARALSTEKIDAHCDSPSGPHDVVVSALHPGLGGLPPRRIVYFAQRVVVP